MDKMLYATVKRFLALGWTEKELEDKTLLYKDGMYLVDGGRGRGRPDLFLRTESGKLFSISRRFRITAQLMQDNIINWTYGHGEEISATQAAIILEAAKVYGRKHTFTDFRKAQDVIALAEQKEKQADSLEDEIEYHQSEIEEKTTYMKSMRAVAKSLRDDMSEYLNTD